MVSFVSLIRVISLAGIVFGAALSLTSMNAQTSTSHPKGFGLVANTEASSQEVGLPFYPGAHVKENSSDDSSAINFGLWGGGNGMKIAVAKLESEDSIEKITAFYSKALAQYGTVLNCSPATAKIDVKDDDDAPNQPVTCDSSSGEDGTVVLKTGTNRNQHIVAIARKNGKLEITLIAIASWQKGGKS